MTDILQFLFSDDNQIYLLFETAWFNIADNHPSLVIPDQTIYILSVVSYSLFVVGCIWLSVKLISWFAHLLGFGGK